MFVLIKIVNSILGEYLLSHVDGLVIDISIIPIILSIILGIITIYLSSISSARKASKVSPIEGLKNADEIKIKSKKLKVPKLISKLFKTGGVLAYKNLKRSKKKYRTTVISLAVSIFIFITMNSFITNMFDFTGDYYENYDYNMKVYSGVDFLSDEEKDKILSLNNIDEHFVIYNDKIGTIRINDLSKINQVEGIELEDDFYYDEEKQEAISTEEGKVSRIQIVGIDNESFKKYAKKIGADYEDIKSSGILCDNYKYYDGKENNTKEIRRYKYQKNDTIVGKYGEEEMQIKVGAVTDIRPYGMEGYYYGGGYLIVNVNEYKNMNFTINNICINSSVPDDLEQDIKNISESINIRNINSEVKQEKSMLLVINIFLYGFMAVITLIGVTNIFNTITSNMELRQKEFAMLKSIGMTKKEFNRMINLETIFYSTKALLYGIILGLLGTFALYKAFSVKMDSGMHIPINPIIISIIFVFILVFIIMKYSISKINKQNTIETIRKENI